MSRNMLQRLAEGANCLITDIARSVFPSRIDVKARRD
jgi:hypothetical protein